MLTAPFCVAEHLLNRVYDLPEYEKPVALKGFDKERTGYRSETECFEYAPTWLLLTLVQLLPSISNWQNELKGRRMSPNIILLESLAFIILEAVNNRAVHFEHS